MSLYSNTGQETSSPFVVLICSRSHSSRIKDFSGPPGLRPSKGTTVWLLEDTADQFDVANEQFVNVIMFNDLTFRDWRCCLLEYYHTIAAIYCGYHKKTSTGTLFLIFSQPNNWHQMLMTWQFFVQNFVTIEPRLLELFENVTRVRFLGHCRYGK